jgi:hypothetical protein
MDVVALSDVSTFFSGWTSTALFDFVQSFPTYFQGDPWGDRHCDMGAFKRFLAQRPPDMVRSNLIEGTPVYDPAISGGDPNFSFAPLVMRWSNVWGYVELQKALPDIAGFLKRSGDRYVLQFPQSKVMHRLDFVHLNGYLKAYLPTIVTLVFETTVADMTPVPAAPVPAARGSSYEPLLWEIVAELYRGILRREGEPRWHQRCVDDLKREGLRGGLSKIAERFIGTEEFLKRNRLTRID